MLGAPIVPWAYLLLGGLLTLVAAFEAPSMLRALSQAIQQPPARRSSAIVRFCLPFCRALRNIGMIWVALAVEHGERSEGRIGLAGGRSRSLTSGMKGNGGVVMSGRRIVGTMFCLLVATAGVAGAQEAEAAAPSSDFMGDYLADFERVGGRLLALAEAVPADKYGWAPSDAVRTVSEVYMHVTGVNFMLPGGLGGPAAAGIEVPEDGPMALLRQLEADVTAKDEVIDMMKKSIEYAKSAVPEIEDLGTEVDLFGFPASKRAYLLILLTHAHEHLGQSIAYARSIGVVPPWSQPQED